MPFSLPWRHFHQCNNSSLSKLYISLQNMHWSLEYLCNLYFWIFVQFYMHSFMSQQYSGGQCFSYLHWLRISLSYLFGDNQQLHCLRVFILLLCTSVQMLFNLSCRYIGKWHHKCLSELYFMWCYLPNLLNFGYKLYIVSSRHCSVQLYLFIKLCKRVLFFWRNLLTLHTHLHYLHYSINYVYFLLWSSLSLSVCLHFSMSSNPWLHRQ